MVRMMRRELIMLEVVLMKISAVFLAKLGNEIVR
jgi:hypothetical protein